MRYYVPSADSFASFGSDGAARTLVLRGLPYAMAWQRCSESGALLIDFSDGSTLEIASGERDATNGTALDNKANAKAWLASIRKARLRYIRDDLTLIADEIKTASEEQRAKLEAQLAAYCEELRKVG